SEACLEKDRLSFFIRATQSQGSCHQLFLVKPVFFKGRLSFFIRVMQFGLRLATFFHHIYTDVHGFLSMNA
ncbi:MAG: hypothetical protein Q4G18_10785, partial [Myroides sp.]|nr:hypothetical protein [Myroides sp.]